MAQGLPIADALKQQAVMGVVRDNPALLKGLQGGEGPARLPDPFNPSNVRGASVTQMPGKRQITDPVNDLLGRYLTPEIMAEIEKEVGTPPDGEGPPTWDHTPYKAPEPPPQRQSGLPTAYQQRHNLEQNQLMAMLTGGGQGYIPEGGEWARYGSVPRGPSFGPQGLLHPSHMRVPPGYALIPGSGGMLRKLPEPPAPPGPPPQAGLGGE